MINVIKVLHDTTVDGPGFRTSIYCAGCRHRCPGCHNQQTWAFGSGTDRSTDDLLQEILADPFADVTFTGGDPLFQAEGFAELAARIKAKSDKTIWCYTGFRYEELLHDTAAQQLLQYVDVLVDGRFVQEQRDEDLLFRGSSNQRLVDVPRSREEGHVVLWQRKEL
ncbi:MAG: anaerobic ribonucleoside-triphosphate reductase activating protein [Bacteroidaceae bacterium]|nr:anaerobic ribonucleoside-triphosphate reductase activating protein [Bacteroidaceae bacterium]